jgi:hypothetical protein
MSELAMYVVYRNPRDYPERFVVRRTLVGTEIRKDAEPLIVCDSLEEARDAIPGGLVCITRSIEDDPVIVETWL